ncbi:MAG: SNF2-related protein [Burkholderiales bacterium]
MPSKQINHETDRLGMRVVMNEIREVFGNTTTARAFGIERDKHDILWLAADEVDEDVWHVHGEVQGSADEPYATDIEVVVSLDDGEFTVLDADCSCPVGNNCKHAAALLMRWVGKWGLEDGGPAFASITAIEDRRLTAAPPASHAEKGTPTSGTGSPRNTSTRKPPKEVEIPKPVTQKTGLPAPLASWLETTIRVGTGSGTGGAAPSAKKKPSPTTRKPCIFYLLTDDGVLHALRGRRRPDGSEPELTGEYATTAWLGTGRDLPSYADENDIAVLTLMATKREYAYGNLSTRINGVQGYQLLQMVQQTGRLYALRHSSLAAALSKSALPSERSLREALVFGEPRAASLTWRANDADPANKMRLAASIEGMPVVLIASDPPYALDLPQHRLVPVSVAISTPTLIRLTALPAIKPDDDLAWAYVRDAIEALPDAVNVPPVPTANAARLLIPKAVLSFVLIEYDAVKVWGRKTTVEPRIFPAVQLLFDYDGERRPAEAQGFSTAVEIEKLGNLVQATRLRNVRAETDWQRRLPTQLLRALQVEYSIAHAALDGNLTSQSLWMLPSHDWAGKGTEVLADAQAAGFAIEIDPSFPLSLEDIPTPELELAAAPENGWYRIALGVNVNGERVDLAPALAKLIGAQHDPEAWLAALPSVPTVLLSVPPKKGKHAAIVVRLPGERVHALLAPVFDWFRGGELTPISGLQAAMVADLPPAAVRYLGRDDPRWLNMRAAIAEGAILTATTPHPAFQASLRAYQLHGLAWLSHLRALSMAGVLADDMGLGKTVQTLAFLHQRAQSASANRRPSLIVAPTSVTVNWLAEIRRFAPTLRVISHYGASRLLDDAAMANADLVLTSYPILQRDEKRLSEIKWDVVVFDEAQTIKNAKAKTYQAAQSLSAELRLALTGTPMENHLGELWALFNLLLPGLLGDLETFNRVFRHPIELRAATEQMQKLRARIRPFMLRRTREQVLADLPEKTEYTRWIELQPLQADLYESLRTAIHDDIRKVIDKKGLKQSTIHILDALLKLRQVCCDPRLVNLPSANKRFSGAGSAKLEWLMGHMPELLEEGRQILVFSQFTSMLALIAEGLTAQGIEFVTLTGETVDRETPINQFQSGAVRVFLLSLKAGGVGLNLTAADTVIHYDPWWNPAVEAQATARAHRIGQTKPVFVTRLVTQGTLEERMMTLLARKRELAAALLEGGGSALTGITLADVESLLAPLNSLAATPSQPQ